MQVTIHINAVLLAKARAEAERQGRPVSDLIEAAIVWYLANPQTAKKIRLPTFNSGGALVDVADRNALYEAMEQDEKKLY